MKILLSFLLICCAIACSSSSTKDQSLSQVDILSKVNSISLRNKQVIDTITQYGPTISSTYKKAVCTELLIPIIERFYKLNKTDKSRIRIITNENIQQLLTDGSPIPKGVCYALVEKGIGSEITRIEDVLPGDFVQFWTKTWGHCGVVKEVNLERKIITMYSSFPSTSGYGIQHFSIPEHCFFVRLK